MICNKDRECLTTGDIRGQLIIETRCYEQWYDDDDDDK